MHPGHISNVKHPKDSSKTHSPHPQVPRALKQLCATAKADSEPPCQVGQSHMNWKVRCSFPKWLSLLGDWVCCKVTLTLASRTSESWFRHSDFSGQLSDNSVQCTMMQRHRKPKESSSHRRESLDTHLCHQASR